MFTVCTDSAWMLAFESLGCYFTSSTGLETEWLVHVISTKALPLGVTHTSGFGNVLWIVYIYVFTLFL